MPNEIDANSNQNNDLAPPSHATRLVGSQQVVDIALDQVLLNESNPRCFIDPVAVEALAASMAADGQKTEIKVRLLENQQYQVVGGDHRVLAARQLGWTTIRAVVLAITPDQAYLEGYLDNQSKPMGWFADYLAIEALWKQTDGKKGSQKPIADRLMKSEAVVSLALKLMPLLNAASREAILYQVKNAGDEQVTQKAILALTGLGDPQKVEEALRVAIDKKMTEPQAKALVASMRAGGSAEAYAPAPKAKATPKVQAGSPHSGISSPSTKPVSVGSGPQDASLNKMSEGETLAWDTVAGISVISRVKAKIKKGERPSFFEALLLMGHYLWRGLVWLNKNGFKLIWHILKFAGKLLLDALKSIAKAFGETFYKVARFVVIIVILGGMVWLAWDIYHHGPLHPIRLIAAKVIPSRPASEPPTIPTPVTTPLATTMAQVPSPVESPVITPVQTVLAEVIFTPTVTTAPKAKAQAKKKPTPATVTIVQPTPTVKKTDIAGDVLKQAAPAGVDVAKKLFGL